MRELTFYNSEDALRVGDVVDNLTWRLSIWVRARQQPTYRLQAVEICLVKGASESTRQRAQSLKLEGNAESIEPLVDEVVNRSGGWPCVILSESTLIS